MAVKAKEQVTVSWIIDIASTTKYYLLQSSTATPPSKPTANPPGGNWKTAEPAYTSGSTNTLYTVEQTLWTNGKVTYSAVCKSSSYEAAKEAWNKAQNAQNTANSANSKIDGLEIGGRNLILRSKGDEKAGFFKNFTKVNNGYGEITLKSKKSYTRIDIASGFLLGCRDYTVGEKVTWSYDIMYTAWNFPTGTTRTEFWMGQRYTNVPSGQTGTGAWRYVTVHKLPAVGENGCELNKWYHVEMTLTIPAQASSNVGTDANIMFYNSNASVEASFTARFKNIKLERGNKATDWTPAPEDTDIKIESYVESEIKKEEDSIKLWAGQTYTTKKDFNALAGRTGTLETWKNEASQKITKDGIIATVGSYYTKDSDFQSATTRITNAESRIAQLNDSIELKVEKDGIISAINQTSESVTISASKINLAGYVSISDLKTSGKTIVNGSNVTTGTISADRIDAKSLFAKQLDATNLHITGNSTFDGTLNGAGGTFSGTVNVTRKFSSGDASVIIGADDTARAITLKPAGLTDEYYITYDGNAVMDVVTANLFNGNASAALALKDKGAANGDSMTFNWSGKTGQPTWLWGGNDVGNMYVYNPSNFSVASAASAAVATHVSLPRVGADVNANGRPATSRAFWREYNSACAYLPDANFYHIFTAQSVDENYTTQLALGMTTTKVAYRCRNNGTWGDWREIPLLSKIGDLTVPAGLYPTTGIYDKHGYANTTTNLNYACYVSSNYRIARYASSSKRYKHDIAEIFDATCRPEALYDLPVVTYRYNDGYCPDEPHGEKLHIGFIAEDVDRLYPAGCGYRDGVPENWNIMEIVPGMLKLIQNQRRDIIKQSTRQDAAESRMESLQYQLQQAFTEIETLKRKLKAAQA